MIDGKKWKGGDIKRIITKFFYKSNYLCYQLLLQMPVNEMILFDEFQDYSSYKEALTFLQKIRSEDLPLQFSGKDLKITVSDAKVA